MAKPAACKFTVGQAVEILQPDFTKSGVTFTWWPCTVEAVEARESRGRVIFDVQVRVHVDGRPHRELVGPRGGNRRIRPAA